MSTHRPTSHHWGPGISEVIDGHLKKVSAHPDDPDPSSINENIVKGIYGSARVRRPAIRKGYLEHGPGKTQGQRGQDQYVEVDWDTALTLVTNELNRAKENYGNSSIFAGSYGWASAGRFHHAQSQLKRFLNCFGGFVRSEGNYSYNAALVLLPHIVGNFRDHVRQATRWKTVATDSDLVVMFGGMALRNVQISGGGIAKHRLRDELLACSQSGVKFVNFSPLRSDASASLNAEWLPPKPGSDTAVMMGIAHTLLIENRVDYPFLNRYTVGFDKVKAYLLGEIDGVIKNAAWAEDQSDIPADRIRKLAIEMSESRTLISTAVGLQRAEYGEQVLWMTITLASMLGQIGLPGGGYGIGYGADASIGTIDRPIRWPSLPQGTNPIENFIPVACVSDMLLNPWGEYEYDGEIKHYSDIRLVWWAGGNPFHHHQDLNRLRQAFQQPETIIVNEISWTGTARHADIVLPVASAMERADFSAGNQDNAVIPMPQSVKPVAESRQEYDIYCELEKRLSLENSFSEGKSADQWLSTMWSELQNSAESQGFDVPNFNDFMAGDIIEFPDPEPEHVFLSSFRQSPDQHPLPTPSGRIELWSQVIHEFGYNDCPGQATWLPPTEWLGAEKAEAFPLHLISGQPETRLHSQYDAGDFSQSKKVNGREPVLIHPNDAASRSIDSGDIVRLHNARGSCLAGAIVSDQVRPGVIFLWTGAWYDPDFTTKDHRDNHGNPNVLTHDRRTSRLAQGPAAHSALVQIEKFEQEAPMVRSFIPPIAQ